MTASTTLGSTWESGPMTGRVANRYFSRAFRWQKRFLFVIITLIAVGLLTFTPLANSIALHWGILVAEICATFSILAVCYYVYRGSVGSRGVLYSLLHVGLIILLLPVCFVGVFVIPSLTNGDVLRVRDSDRQRSNRP